MRFFVKLALFIIVFFLWGCAGSARSVVSTDKEVKLEREQSYQDYTVKVFRTFENGVAWDGHFEILKGGKQSLYSPWMTDSAA